MRNLRFYTQGMKKLLRSATAWLEHPWTGMKLNAEEIAERRRNRLERGEHNFLWCWQHRGFW
ncbi:hypothetical protein DKP76_07855 [Falsochrobactrum shanghaiense]|uniref:Uncharacterized protein n=1 Tax=Falsochrobactrum shanghaiense TaxID=2201899 RepID=A0A316JEX0_9HYPH|nr:hypothetical protein [Falsochrobactrum shanghaiense]PWL17683.1 hypothetical protein DKP76_07855 [Falsochrobactrum shanghaiense]